MVLFSLCQSKDCWLQVQLKSQAALNWPTVIFGRANYGFEMSDYRNVLCERITKIIRSASVIESLESVSCVHGEQCGEGT